MIQRIESGAALAEGNEARDGPNRYLVRLALLIVAGLLAALGVRSIATWRELPESSTKGNGLRGEKDSALGSADGLSLELAQPRNGKFAVIDDWIWGYTRDPVSPLPMAAMPSSRSRETVGVPPLPPVGARELGSPVFSVVTGIFPVSEYDLQLCLLDPNPGGKGQIMYRVNSSDWNVHSGLPVTVPPGAHIAAFVKALDPAWSDSAESAHNYDVAPAQLSIPLISSSAAKFDFEANQTILITMTNLNNDSASSIEFRTNQGEWRAYRVPFEIDVLSNSPGVEIEARVVSISPLWLASETAARSIGGVTGVKLDAPMIRFSEQEFSRGVDSIGVELTNPNQGASEIHFKVAQVSGGPDAGMNVYSGPVEVRRADFPEGFVVKAYVKSVAPPYTDSDFSLESTGSFFGDDFNRGGLAGSFYDLERFADGSPTNIEAATNGSLAAALGSDLRFSEEFNPTFYDYVKQITPEFPDGSGWGFERAMLEQFYSSANTVFASRFSTPELTGDKGALHAFGVNVLSSNWIAHYGGSIERARPGWYRFSGRADDVLEVWIDDKLALSAAAFPWVVTPGFPWTDTPTDWKSYIDGEDDVKNPATPPYSDATEAIRSYPVAGPWVYLDGIHGVDIIVGKQARGNFYANLRVEEKGGSYADGPQVLTTRPLSGDDALEISRAFPGSAPGVSNPPVFHVVE